MKTVKNKEIVLELVINSVTVPEKKTYAELIFLACNKPSNPQTGFSYEDMKAIDKVATVCNGKKTVELKFEDSDFDFVKSRVETMTWGLYSKSLIEFVDYIKAI